MEETITLIICLSLVFVITLGIVSYTLRDEKFKVRFDDRNKRLSRIIKDQRDELHSYREAIKKNDANLQESISILTRAQQIVQSKISYLEKGESILTTLKNEIENYNLHQKSLLNKLEDINRSFSITVKSLDSTVLSCFKKLDERLVQRPSYLSPEEKKHFKEYMQSAARGYTFISNMPNKMDKDFVSVEDVYKALEFVGRDQWDSLYIKYPSEEEFNNGQNTERNQ
nr:MAG TPA: hypothetical protein [Caudoviricetes sp.]